MKVKKAVIPAAGFGTRMLPATKVVPKEMLPLVDKPGIQYIVEEAVDAGIEDILIIVGRGKSSICDYFDYSPELERHLDSAGRETEAEMLRTIAGMANVSFVRQKELRGLGHAVSCAKSFTGDEPFAVLLGDDVMVGQPPVIRQLIDVSERYGCATVGVASVPSEQIGKYCSLDVSPLEERVFSVRGLIEKPRPQEILSNYAILGRYLLTPEIYPILQEIPTGYGGEIQLTDALNVFCQRSQLLAVEFCGTRYDTGNLEGYLRATVELSLNHPNVGDWFRNYLKGLEL